MFQFFHPLISFAYVFAAATHTPGGLALQDRRLASSAAGWLGGALSDEAQPCQLNVTHPDYESSKCDAGFRCAPCYDPFSAGAPPPPIDQGPSTEDFYNSFGTSTEGLFQYISPPPPASLGYCASSFDGQCLPCELGDYCPEGSTNPYFWTKYNICPAGSICPNATVELPCQAGWFCPEGSFTYVIEMECPAHGSYCEEGSKELEYCPAGWFCPTPASKNKCPAGKYCRYRSHLCRLLGWNAPSGAATQLANK
ncbi:hypothetical protein CYMTET_25178, partial [Cymbomonas tetramitiformis]